MKEYEGLTLADLQARYDAVKTSLARASTRRNEIDERMKPLHDERSKAVADVKGHHAELGRIEAEIDFRKRPRNEPTVTDHALLRYIERVHGIDMDKLRAHILTEEVKDAMLAGATAIKKDGVTMKVTNCSIITVLTDTIKAERPNRLTRAQRERLEDGGSYHAVIGDWDGWDPTPGSRTGF